MYLQAALLVLVIYNIDEFLLGGALFFVHYNGKCWYLYFRWGILSICSPKLGGYPLARYSAGNTSTARYLSVRRRRYIPTAFGNRVFGILGRKLQLQY